MNRGSRNLAHDALRAALFACTLLPAAIYLFFEYSGAQQTAAREAAIQARIVDHFVGRNPEGWRFAGDRLADTLARVRDPESQTRLLDGDGTELSRAGGEETAFWVSRGAPFHDFGQPVGQVLVGVDMWPKVTNGALLGGLGLMAGLLLLVLLNRYVATPLEQAETAHRECQTRLNDLLELSSDWFWETDAKFRFTRVARGKRPADGDADPGPGPGPDPLVGKYYWEIDCDWTAEQWAEHYATLLAHRPFAVDYPATVGGAPAWFGIRAKPLFDRAGRFAGYRGTVREVTEGVRTQENLRIAETAFEMQECIAVTDAWGRLLRVNKAFLAVTGYTADEVLRQSVALLGSDRQDDACYRHILAILRQDKFWQGELWTRHKNGECFLSELVVKGVASPGGEVEHYVGSFHDITARREAENNIHELAFYDPLTHLPNRRLLFDRLHKAQAASSRSGGHGALMFIDLDNFKNLNDTRGHDVGDLLLCEVAARLRAIVRSDDSVVRLGGDEFVVMLENLDRAPDAAAAEADEVGRKLLSCLNEPFILQGQEVHSTPSVGVVLFCGETQSIEQLLKHADAAMYQSKAAGRNALHFFDPEMQATLEARAAMETDLRAALKAGQFRLYYQAQVDVAGNIIGAEVLLRWIHPLRGMISPAEFIPLAEDCGAIQPLGQWVLDAACTQLKMWAAHPETSHLTLAVNVSARQYHQTDFAEQVLAVLDQSGTDPRKLKLELTESLLVKDVEGVIRKMTILKARGIGFSLDDFGTGYSSLSYLKRLPLDQLKIDQSFVRDLEHDGNDAAICAATIGLAHNLGLKVVAEGVETEAQRYFLSTVHRCDFMQGYLFAKPLPQTGFEALLAETAKKTAKAPLAARIEGHGEDSGIKEIAGRPFGRFAEIGGR